MWNGNGHPMWKLTYGQFPKSPTPPTNPTNPTNDEYYDTADRSESIGNHFNTREFLLNDP